MSESATEKRRPTEYPCRHCEMPIHSNGINWLDSRGVATSPRPLEKPEPVR